MTKKETAYMYSTMMVVLCW